MRSEFGFDPEFAQNPYTRANLLDRAAKQQFNRTGNSAAARGQLYAGNLNRRRASDTFAAGQALDTSRRDYNQSLTQIQADKAAAQRGFAQGSDNAYLDLLDRLTSAAPDPSAYTPPSSYGGAPPKKKGKKK